MEQNTQLTRVTPERLFEAVVAQLQNLIVTGELNPGDRLLPERELAQHFGVSRTAVRDAIKVLAERGLVEVRVGAGTFVVRKTSEALTESMGLLLQMEKSPAQGLQEVRAAIETEMAAFAAERATESDLVNLARRSEELQLRLDDTGNVIGDATLFAREDMAFHGAVADAAHNNFYRHLLNPIVEQLVATLTVIAESVPEAPARVLDEHRQILNAIQRKSRDEAREAMRQHMDQIARDIEAALPL